MHQGSATGLASGAEDHPPAPDSAIRCGIRCRPLVPHEKGQKVVFDLTNDTQVSVRKGVLPDPNDEKKGPWRFDEAMDSTKPGEKNCVDNPQCYKLMGRNIVDHALEGFNACLFCYGQTGTGKTTTILGDEHNGDGILVLLFKDLFIEVQKEEERGGTLTICIQMLEVYNEKVFDLLADDGGGNVEMHVLPTGVQIDKVCTKDVASAAEVMKWLDKGASRKHIAATAMNPQSSRGHTVFKIVITKEEDGVKLKSEVYFADLAGHEDATQTKVTGDRMIELSNINKSLFHLQAAIHGMVAASNAKGKAKKSTVSLFRNSKLTLLLANALTGNSLVNVIVTISPAVAHFPTSLRSLSFANEVKHIAVAVHTSATTDPVVVVKKLELDVKRLEEELAAAQAGGGGAGAAGAAEISSVLTAKINKSKMELVEAESEVNFLKEQLELAQEAGFNVTAVYERLNASSSRSRTTSAVTPPGTPDIRNSSRPTASNDQMEAANKELQAAAVEMAELRLRNQDMQAAAAEVAELRLRNQDMQAAAAEVGELRLRNQGLQRELNLTKRRETDFDDDLEDLRGNIRTLRAELDASDKRENRLQMEKQALANTAKKLYAGQFGGDDQFIENTVIFSPDVANSLDAITSKVSNLCKEMEGNGMATESRELAEMLGRAKNLVPENHGTTSVAPSRVASYVAGPLSHQPMSPAVPLGSSVTYQTTPQRPMRQPLVASPGLVSVQQRAPSVTPSSPRVQRMQSGSMAMGTGQLAVSQNLRMTTPVMPTRPPMGTQVLTFPSVVQWPNA